MPDRSDDELVKEILRGNVDAAEILYQRYSHYIYKILYRKTAGRQQDAEDLTHDVWMKLTDALPAYTPQGKFQQWINAIIRTIHIDWERARARQLSFEDDENYEVTFAEIRDVGQPPELELEGSELQDLADEALAAMPDNAERRAFMLHDFEGYSHKEIANMLDISEIAAKMKAFRGRKRFRETFYHIARDYR